MGYGYSARGERVSLIYPDTSQVGYVYWPDGQLKTVTQGSTTLASYTYDPAGRLDTVVRGNGATTNYDYDGADRLRDLHTTVGGSTTSRFEYDVNRLGLREAVDETLGATTRQVSYAYDGLLRLTGATESTGASYAYGYDLAGNRTSVTVNGTTTTTAYNAANQVAGWGYDAAGNLLSDGSTTSTYDALGRMTSRSGTSYSYNGDGVLVAQSIGGNTTRYAQDPVSSLSQVLNDGTANYLYGRDRLAAQAGGTTTWYAADALGSIRQTLDSAGALLATASYDPWGTPQGNAISPFGFTGELQDAQGLTYLRARWYNPEAGTFTSRDSFIGFANRPETLHPYVYVGNKPVLLSDPSGHCYPPVEFLRDIESLNCSNLDQAINIIQQPNATNNDRILSGGYITAFVGSHAALLIGAGILTWEAVLGGSGVVTTVSQWGAANVAAGTTTGHAITVGGTALGLGGTGYTIYQAANGDNNAQAFLACPTAFGVANLWGDLANVTRAGYRSARALIAPNAQSTLIAELLARGTKINVDEVIAIARNQKGEIVWLEQGVTRAQAQALGRNGGSGLAHILEEHQMDFVRKGVAVADIPDVVMNAVINGHVVGYQGKGTARPIYEVMYQGKVLWVAVQYGSNGYVIGANPASKP